MGRYVTTLLLAALATFVGAQEPQDAGKSKPKPELAGPPAPEAQSKIDLGTAIAEVAGRMLATPRFQDQIEVHDQYQEALNAYLHSADINCGPRGGPAPTPYDDMDRVAGTSQPASADLLSGFKWLFHKSKKGSDSSGRYYVYSVTMAS